MNYETQFASDVNMEPMGIDEDRARKRRRIIIAIVIAAVVLIAAALAFGKKSDGAADSAGGAAVSAPVVTVLSPGQSSVQRTVTATGSLNARIDMPVGVVGEGGQVVRVLVQPGDWVRAGQTLAVIERSVQSEQAKSLAAQIAVAQADAKLAKAQLDRARQLVGRGFISQADIDQREATLAASNARVGVAQAQLAEQRARNGRLDIRAPASGLVLTRAVEPGQVVGTGSGVLFRVAKNGEMELRAMLSEADLARVRSGVPASVTPVGGTQSVAGHVWQVSPVIDPVSRQGIARVAVPYTPAIRPGGFAAVSIVTSTGDAPLLPESAVQSDPAGNYVYIVNAKNQVERRAVTVGQVSSAGVAVTSGLNGKERIVASAGAFLNPGQKVKPELQKTDSQKTAG
ncbi:efflux RND transporter periplasmic adaptor subunit [soil metagenome]|jgi:HlyD family secretion protein|uniref:efflux RND transporter periplasmic adaptor subunit n=1 Tax=unclassified Sphingobium TaxID=2611147 RepID=UPI001E283E0B|nr:MULTISPECIES: efflux RND transporter periplasmic adaptor subunit [unclassified Sphingobium]GLI99432.1 hemolysin secretion protein D [Sphingobium sp. BS19]CAH0348726.1 Multidrug resistance protein MdtA [Sphingobium sp. CECT 9361]